MKLNGIMKYSILYIQVPTVFLLKFDRESLKWTRVKERKTFVSRPKVFSTLFLYSSFQEYNEKTKKEPTLKVKW